MFDRSSDVVTLVLADDHASFRETVVELLKGSTGLRVVADVSDGIDALAAIRLNQPAVAVLDVEMPGLTGLDVARAVRQSGLSTALVILTMHADLYLMRTAMELGIAGYVLKDDLDTDLVPAIFAAAEKKAYFQSQGCAAAGRRPVGAPVSDSSRALGGG